MANFTGSAGDDTYAGGINDDTIIGNAGNDVLSGGGGGDIIAGGAGEDVVSGGDGDDKLYSGDLSPPFSRPYQNNPYTPPLMDTGSAVDTLVGGDGNDTLFAGYGDNVDGGANDVFGDKLYISFLGGSSGVTVDFNNSTLVVGGGTIKNFEYVNWIQGTNFDDVITDRSGGGYSDFSVIEGMGGNDQITASYYTGTILGGDGDDVLDGRPSQYLQSIHGGAGADIIYTNPSTFGDAYGDDGDDIIYSNGTTYGGAGDDLIVMQVSYYTGQVSGDAGDDDIRAAAGIALIAAGGTGADLLTGDSGNDVLYSADRGEYGQGPLDDMGAEHDVIVANDGDDTLAAGYGDDVDGGTGADTLRLSLGGAASGVVFSTAGIVSGAPFSYGGGTIQNVETLVYLRGSEFGDALTLVAQSTVLTVDAGAGDDVITSSSTKVYLSGGAGDDRFVSGMAANTFDGGAGVDTIDYHGAAAGVTVDLAAGNGVGGDILIDVEGVIGSAFDDTVFIAAGLASNVLDGGAGIDTASYAAAESGVYVDLGLVGAQQTSGSGLDTLVGFENLIGSLFSDTLTGNALANILTGGTGNDTLAGRGGVDTLNGGAGSDTASYSAAAGGVNVDLGALTASNDGDGASDILSSIENVTGSAFVDHIWGDGGANTLRGGGGDDMLYGMSGDDTLIGGAGNDYLGGGVGNDTYEVTEAGDSVFEAFGQGQDLVFSYLSRYDLTANVENLALAGSAVMGVGNALDNTLYGNAQDNTLIGGAGNDAMVGGAGNDTYEVTEIGDAVYENAGEGNDVVFSYASRFTLGANVETLVLVGSAVLGAGNAQANTLYGNALDNTLIGGAGNDAMVGGAGNDTYEVTETGDSIYEYAGEGNDVVFSYASRFDLSANIETLVLVGSAVTGVGNAQDNVLYGNAQNNTLIGGGGNDIMVGGVGNDSYEVTEAGDAIYENAAEGNDVVFSYLTRYDLGANLENLVLAGSAQMAVGNAQDNMLQGNALANTLIGGAGNDVMIGGGGDDTYEVTEAGDSIIEAIGGGKDVVFSYVDSYTLSANIETLILVGGAHTGMGNEQANTLVGNDLDNFLVGWGGNDLMIGGAGDDIYNVTEAGDVVVEAAGGGRDLVSVFFDGYVLPAEVEILYLAGSATTGTGNGLDNLLVGGIGNDNLNGAGGNDYLTGWEGRDSFWFVGAGAGRDIVADFTDGIDRVVMDHALFADFAAVQAHAAQVGDNVVITHDQNTTLTLEHFSLANLTASDFVFV